jgi:hypothetical protein
MNVGTHYLSAVCVLQYMTLYDIHLVQKKVLKNNFCEY